MDLKNKKNSLKLLKAYFIINLTCHIQNAIENKNKVKNEK